MHALDTHTHIHTHTRVHTHARVHTHTHTHMCTHIHTHTAQHSTAQHKQACTHALYVCIFSHQANINCLQMSRVRVVVLACICFLTCVLETNGQGCLNVSTVQDMQTLPLVYVPRNGIFLFGSALRAPTLWKGEISVQKGKVQQCMTRFRWMIHAYAPLG